MKFGMLTDISQLNTKIKEIVLYHKEYKSYREHNMRKKIIENKIPPMNFPLFSLPRHS